MNIRRNLRRDSTIDEYSKIHHEWVCNMGWNNTTILEKLALVASEVGEAVNECRGERPTKQLGEELADICLRVMDIAEYQQINLQKAIYDKILKNEKNGHRGKLK